MTFSKKQMSYFKAAKAVSESSDHPVHRIGCVVVNKHRIISSGCNSVTRCDSLQAIADMKNYGVYCPGKTHAENDALGVLKKQRVDLSCAEVYVYREHRDGTVAISRPCSSCMDLIKSCGIKVINYTTEDGYAREVIL